MPSTYGTHGTDLRGVRVSALRRLRARVRLHAVWVLVGLPITLAGCGHDGLDAEVGTSGSATTVPVEVIRCASGAEEFVATAASDRETTISRDDALAMLAAKDGAAAEAELITVTIPSTSSNAEPNQERYRPGSSGNPGRVVDRLAWQGTKPAPEGSRVPFNPPPGASFVQDEATCTVREIVTFIDATKGWPLGTFLIT